MAKFDLKKAILENKATFFGSLTEGQFSWMTQDTGQQIGSQDENIIPVYMFDDKGKYYYENDYEGYGVFGGKDYYDLVAEMNGYTADDAEKLGGTFGELRGVGIKLAFGELEPKNGGPVLFPALVTKPDRFNYKTHDFTQEAETDPNQSWYEPEEEDYYDQNDEDEDYNRYGDEDEEELDEIKEIKPTTKMKKSELKAKIKEMVLAEYERDVDYTDETAGYDFLAELEGMLDEADGLTPLQDYVYQYEIEISGEDQAQEYLDDIKKLNTPDDVYDYYAYGRDWQGSMDDDLENIYRQVKRKFKNLSEADETEKDTAEAEDVTVDDTETIDTETTTEVDPNVKAVQDALTQAQAAAQKLGDPKLTDQIGNTITFFTRAHVVEKGAVAEGDLMQNIGKGLEYEATEEMIRDYASRLLNNLKNSNHQFDDVEDYFDFYLRNPKDLPEPMDYNFFRNNYDDILSLAMTGLDEGKKEDLNESMFPMLKKILK